MAVTHYRELIAWQRAMDMVVAVYAVTRAFPREEPYGLTNQVRRAAVAVPSNIAEGQGRGASDAFANFLRIANGSRQEAQTQLLIAVRRGYASDADIREAMALAEEVGRLLAGLQRSLSTGN